VPLEIVDAMATHLALASRPGQRPRVPCPAQHGARRLTAGSRRGGVDLVSLPRALPHTDASALIEAGESVKGVSTGLGDASTAETLYA